MPLPPAVPRIKVQDSPIFTVRLSMIGSGAAKELITGKAANDSEAAPATNSFFIFLFSFRVSGIMFVFVLLFVKCFCV